MTYGFENTHVKHLPAECRYPQIHVRGLAGKKGSSRAGWPIDHGEAARPAGNLRQI